MIELARRRMMMGSSSKPYDAEVEYIENDGQCIINSEYNSSSDTSLECKFYLPTSITGTYGAWLYGGRDINNIINMPGIITPPYDSNNTTQARFGSSFALGYKHYGTISIRTQKRKITVISNSGTETKISPYTSAFYFTTPIYIFGFNLSTGDFSYNNTHAGSRLYYWRVYENSTLMQDMIPVRIGTRGMLYDKISGNLFDRIDDGLDAHFTPGPDKTN